MRITVKQLKQLIEESGANDDTVIRCGSDMVERFDHLEAIGFDNDINTLILYFTAA